jgi:patatin-like phospholipase/acyl hydrolase
MKPPLDPPKPLKILTIDGGGLQAITTLLILDKLLDAIAKNNKVNHQKPRPCDVFDTIAGIGSGGWLAILLGRFHMDITACLSEWYKITSHIAPKS